MSQHDLSIANQGFPAFRSDLNDALQALGSLNSGTTAPSTTYANMPWYDTTNNILKIRNEDNDAWISILELNQTTDAVARIILAALKSTGTSLTVEDSSGNTIATIAQGDILVAGTSTSAGSISLAEDTDNGTNKVVLKAAASIASNLTFVLPSADGSSGQALVTDGSGNLSFASAGGDKITEGNSSVEVVDTGTGYVVTTIDGTEVARITPDGLAIGTTNPAGFKLFVSGGRATFNAGDDYAIRIGKSGTYGGYIGAPSADVLSFYDSSGNEGFKLNNGTLQINNGYGSIATFYGCRAWVNFNGSGTVAIRASGNVSSITDNGTGDYTVNFTNAMPDVNYSLTGNCSSNNTFPSAPSVSGVLHINASTSPPYKSQPTTTSCRVVSSPDNTISAGFDAEYINLSIFR